jgi:hypothetical protein
MSDIWSARFLRSESLALDPPSAVLVDDDTDASGWAALRLCGHLPRRENRCVIWIETGRAGHQHIHFEGEA